MMRELPKRIFVAGTGTGIGKTVVSAILVEALQADYWKPVQCGDLDDTDTDRVRSLISNSSTKIFPEAYKFKTASSPHYASDMENTVINPEQFNIPDSEIRLIIESAGGLMVPLSDDYLVIDLIKYLKASVILVSKNYLGSINHTLLSLEALKHRSIDVLGVIYNGKNYYDNEEIIHHFTGVNNLGEISMAQQVNQEFISEQALQIRESIAQYFLI